MTRVILMFQKNVLEPEFLTRETNVLEDYSSANIGDFKNDAESNS